MAFGCFRSQAPEKPYALHGLDMDATCTAEVWLVSHWDQEVKPLSAEMSLQYPLLTELAIVPAGPRENIKGPQSLVISRKRRLV